MKALHKANLNLVSLVILKPMPSIKLLILLLSIAAVSPLWAQSDTHLESWAGATYRIKWNKNWATKLSTQWRGRYDLSDRDFRSRGLFELEGTYDPTFNDFFKTMRVGLGVRLLVIDNPATNHLFRFHVDLMKEVPFKRWTFGYRLRYQMRDDFRAKETVYRKYWTKDLRNLFSLQYNFKKWQLDPTVWAEFFLHDELGARSGWTHFRVGIKTHYKFNQQHRLSVRYFLEHGLEYYTPPITHTVVVQYQYSLNWKKRPKR